MAVNKVARDALQNLDGSWAALGMIGPDLDLELFDSRIAAAISAKAWEKGGAGPSAGGEAGAQRAPREAWQGTHAFGRGGGHAHRLSVLSCSLVFPQNQRVERLFPP